MAQKASKNKHDNDNSQEQIEPTDRLDFLNAVAMDPGISAKEFMAVRVATILLKHRHNLTGKIILKRKTIADEIGCSPSAVDKGVAVLKRRGWCNVRHVYGKRHDADTKVEIIANEYDPRWDKAAAVGGIWSIESKKLTGEVPYRIAYNADGSVASDERAVIDDRVSPRTTKPLRQNEETPTSERGGVSPRTLKLNSESVTHGSKPGVLNPGFHTASGEAVETGSGSEEDRPPGASADDDKAMTDYVESLTQPEFLRILEESLPAYVPFDEHRHQRDPARASEHQFKKLMRLGWKRLEILQGVEAYLREFDRHDNSTEFHGAGKCGKTLGGLFAQLVEQCNPEWRNADDGEMYDNWRIPDRFLTKPADKVKPPASNDNELSDIDIAV